jgi:hypothetical protein
MPTPPTSAFNFQALANTHIKVGWKGFKFDTVLLFGAGKFTGRLTGAGMLTDKSSWKTNSQYFRMDYHVYHGKNGDWGSRDFAKWRDDPFHYHIPYDEK